MSDLLASLGQEIRRLKESNGDLSLIEAKTKQLKLLKEQEKKKQTEFILKTPKGTRDYNDREMAVRNKLFSTVINVFEKHGGVTIDTPVFELKDILTGKYGEDSKLIYDLKDQGGEECSLRYDLTVPFARFLAMHGPNYHNMKRYAIGKVYRRDQPAMTKGRYREFYQCDFDIAGEYDVMVADAEGLSIMSEILDALDIGEYAIKLNHRKILDGIFSVCKVPENKFRTICSAVDKLDKLSWEEVKKEMTEEKGLDEAIADKIRDYVMLKGGEELVDKLLKDALLMSNDGAKKAMEEMKLLFKYLNIFKVEKISFDLSLARGLDYYTGVIYEAIMIAMPETGKKSFLNEDGVDESEVRLGSIASGGRYDELAGMFMNSNLKKGKKGVQIPCVGISIGVERVYSVMLQKLAMNDIKAKKTQVYVISVKDGLLDERMKIAKELWDAGISAEFAYKEKPRFQTQLNQCDKDKIPYAVLIGTDEVHRGVVKIKNMKSKEKSEEEGKAGIEVKRIDMIAELMNRLEDKV